MRFDLPLFLIGVLPTAFVVVTVGLGLLLRPSLHSWNTRSWMRAFILPWWFQAVSAFFFLTMGIWQVTGGSWFAVFFLGMALYYLAGLMLTVAAGHRQPSIWRVAILSAVLVGTMQGLIVLANQRDTTAFIRFQRELQDPDPEARASAAFFLSGLPWKARDAVPVLRAALNDEVAIVRVGAARTMWRLDPSTAAEVASVLVIALDNKDRDGKARRLAAQTLGELGPKARVAVPALEALVNHNENEYERFLAAQALTKIDKNTAETVIPILRKELTSWQPYSRKEAADALGSLGIRAKAVLPDLEKMQHDAEPWLRDVAKAAITAIREDDRQ